MESDSILTMTDLIPVAVFASISLGVWGLLSLFSGQGPTADRRLDEVIGRAGTQGRRDRTQASLIRREAKLEKIIAQAGESLKPKDEKEKVQLRDRLTYAGFRADNAPMVYLGLKLFSLITGLAIAIPITIGQWGFTLNGITYASLGAAVGFYLPGMVLGNLVKRRQQSIFLSLPDALDLMVVSVEAGLGMDAAMRRVTTELADSCPEICEELGIVNFQMQMGRPRKDAMRDLGNRTGVDDVRALSAVIIQAEKFGASIGSALRVQSNSMRTKRRQLAEEKAAKTAVQIMIPLILFIFPGIFVVLVGPAGIQIANTLMK